MFISHSGMNVKCLAQGLGTCESTTGGNSSPECIIKEVVLRVWS